MSELFDRCSVSMQIEEASPDSALEAVGSLLVDTCSRDVNEEDADFLLLSDIADFANMDSPPRTASAPASATTLIDDSCASKDGSLCTPGDAAHRSLGPPAAMSSPMPDDDHEASVPSLELCMRDARYEASKRWLTNAEVLEVLLNWQTYGFTVEHSLAKQPPSGALLLFRRTEHRGFRVDGYEWRMKKKGRQLAETHEKLKVEGVPRLVCYYSQTQNGR